MRRALMLLYLTQAASRSATAFVRQQSTAAATTPRLTMTTDGPEAKKVRTALAEVDQKGAFKRVASVYRSSVKEPPYAPEAGRYHLYVSYACPWAHRTLIVRALKGLTGAIGYTAVHPTWQHTRPDDPNDAHAGWVFAPKGAALTPISGTGSITVPGTAADTIGPFKTVRDIYETVGDTNGKYTVPVLFDQKTRTIVNNESSEIIEMLNRDFGALASPDAPDLDPPDLKEAQEEVNKWIYPGINNGVYRCGFAQSQEAYDTAVTELCQALDRAEDILSRQRYIAGDRLTLADVRLFVTLARFDEVYVVYFKCNVKPISAYPNLTNYVREIYQMPGVADTVNMAHIKAHYYTSHPVLNHFSIVPRGPGAEADFKRPHDRERLPRAT